MKKGNNHNTPLHPIAKPGTWIDALSGAAFEQFPEKDNWRKRLIFTLFLWLEDPNNIEIEDFYYEYRIPRTTMWNWRQKYEDINAAFIQAKIFIGARRRKGSMNFKLHYQSAYRDMQEYDEEWKKVDAYHNEMKAAADKAQGNNKEYIYEKIIEYRDKPE